MVRDTIGKISSELLEKPLETNSPIEQMREQLNDYDKNIFECIERGVKTFSDDFYVVVITKKERLMPNVIRNYFTNRLSCPTPEYDQTVYRYLAKEEAIAFLWVIPSKDTCQLLIANKEQVDPSEFALLDFVLKFYDGTLFQTAKRLNGEEKDSIILA